VVESSNAIAFPHKVRRDGAGQALDRSVIDGAAVSLYAAVAAQP
jgi:hypothetical protein